MSRTIGTVSRWRKRRGELLARQIRFLADKKHRRISVLDVGGTPEYWDNIDPFAVTCIDKIILLTDDKDEAAKAGDGLIEYRYGDARDLGAFGSKTIDLVHSNSVIEHVGYWEQQLSMARECQRVGKSGWIQTPAFCFPIEPHFKLPFIHWLGQPLRRMYLSKTWYRPHDLAMRRWHVDRINLLTKAELRVMFQNRRIRTERVLGFTKSYVVQW